ncbi:MAG: SusC/RagA family TonB-linked outer membrane protein [Bacteroidales bacterium]|nr:SusC/RagA family TonB-linked outer membrane protein [Bacteroidales bacterium]
MKKLFIFSLFAALVLSLGSPALFAQGSGKNQVWTGIVVDANGEPIIGAAVLIAGKANTGSITEIDGTYSISAAADDELIFSCLGYQNETFKAGSAAARRVILKDDSVALESAVVTALGIKRDEKAIGYSVTKVDSDKFASAGTTGNWLNGMTGQVAGLNIDRSSGPNGSMRVTVRGESSASLENNTALFVVDGVPMFNTATTSDGGGEGSSFAIDYGNGTADIDPENIESVTVLKGAAATALYGSAASNGAIIITTKSAEGQDAVFKVSFKSSFAADLVLASPDLQYEYGQGSTQDYYYYLGNDIEDRDHNPYPGLDPVRSYNSTAALASWGPKMDGTPYYQYYNRYNGTNLHYDENGLPVRDATPFVSYGDWFKRYFKTGLTFNNALVLSGKINKDNSVRVSYTNNTATGIVPNSPSQTNSLSLRTTSQLGKWLRVETSVNYRNIKQDNIPVSSGYGSTAIMYSLWCYAPNVDMAWAQDYWIDPNAKEAVGQNSTLSGSKNNAYFLAYECINNQLKDRVYGNVSFKADIVKGLDLTIRGGLDISNDFRTQRQATSTQAKPLGWYREQNITNKQYTGDFLLKYNTKFAGDFEFTGNFGGSILYREYGRHNQTATSLMIPGVYSLANAAYEPKTLNYSYKRQTNSLYGMVSFSWKNCIFLDVTGRNDWSSTLPAKNRSFFYPSVSGSIALNDLFEFGRENGLLNLLKIRASWAQVGNDTAPYRIEEALQYTGFPGTVSVPTAKFNSDLRPEIVSSWEVGIELRMFKNRLSLDAAYYDAVTKDLISQMPVSYANGVNYMYVNAGSIRNRGVEATLSGTVIKTRDFQWKLGANFTLNRNTVVSLGEGIDSWIVAQYSSHAYMTAYEGGSLTSMYGKGFKRAPQGSTAIDATGKVVDVSGLLVLDEQNYAQVGTDLQYLGEVAPDWKGGFNTTFKYKGVSLYIGFDGQVGGHCWSYSNWVMNYRGKGINTLEGRQGGFVAPGVRVLPDGNYIVNTTPFSRDGIQDWYESYYDQTNAEVNFVSTQFLKLREVRLEWQLPKKWLAKTKVLSGIALSAYGSNLYCWSDFPIFDPEGITMRGSAVVPGFEVVQMPSTAQFGASINLTF